ncbi:MAG: hypothetical protein QM611_10485 [Microbacterium sp.]|uniref:hypothetical protein n=1 Tax=Microbacterium sp. TaxID=51671 RepID=UPI0039E25901
MDGAANRAGATGIMAASVVVLGLLAPAPAAAVAETPARVPLEGVLKVTPVEPDATGGGAVVLVTADGARVELTGDAVASAVSGDRFDGTVVVSEEVRAEVARRTARSRTADAAELGELVADVSADTGAALQVAAAEVEPSVSSSTAATAHTVDVLYAGLPGGDAPSTSVVDDLVERLDEFWVSQSNGQIAEVTRPLPVQYVEKTAAELCDQDGMWELAAGASGFNRTGVTGAGSDSYYWASENSAHLVVLVPAGVCDGAIGQATVGRLHAGGIVWAAVDPASPEDWDGVVFHEIGHNLGLEHSNATSCARPAVDGPECAQVEYRDFYDVMGGSYTWGEHSNTRHIAELNVTHKALLDALPRGTALREVRASGSFTLAAASSLAGTRGLEVHDPLTGDVLYIEYRSGTGRDAQSFYTGVSAESWAGAAAYAPGVRVLRVGCTPASACTGWQSRTSTVLPRWAGSTAVMSYGAGNTFVSRATSAGASGVRIAVTSVSAASARVRVSLAPHTLTAATPRVSGKPRVGSKLTALRGHWTAGTTISYRWFVGGKAVSGATKKTFTPRAAHKGKKVKVRVTGKKPGYTTVVKTSKATRAVTR